MARAARLEKMPEPPEGMVNVVITCDHTYLPLDEKGNVREEWADAPGPLDSLMEAAGVHDATAPGARNKLRSMAEALDPKRVEKRTRLAMPLELAEMMEAREQLEIL